MFSFILVMVVALFMIYYGLAYMGFLPYFELFSTDGNMYISLIHGVLSKWSIAFGILFMLFAIFGVAFSKRADNKFNDLLSTILVFSIVYSILLII